MQTKKLQKIFPKGSSMPDGLVKLCDYTTRSHGRIACDFELTASGGSYVSAWFRDDDAVAKQFIIFGVDKPQSLYGFWTYEGRSVDDAPIVYLGSEGTDNLVLANKVDDFLRLLALGHDEIGLVRAWNADTKPCANLDEYRKWLVNDRGLDQPKDDKAGKAIVDAAKRRHPDLDEWVKDWRRRADTKSAN